MPFKITPEKEELIFKWVAMSASQRKKSQLPTTSVGMAKHMGVGYTTFHKYTNLYWAKKNTKVMDPGAFKEEASDEEWDFERWKRDTAPVAADALSGALRRNMPSAIKLYYELTGEYVQKQEIKIGLTGDETARRNLEAEKELRESGYSVGTGRQRVEEVTDKPALLLKDVREDTEQGGTGDNPVA